MGDLLGIAFLFSFIFIVVGLYGIIYRYFDLNGIELEGGCAVTVGIVFLVFGIVALLVAVF